MEKTLKTRITVTQKHINHGQRHAPPSCPIALAVKEQLGTDDAWVDGSFIRAGRPSWDAFQEYWTPATAKPFIEDFDAGLVVEPFSFEMEGAAFFSRRTEPTCVAGTTGAPPGNR